MPDLKLDQKPYYSNPGLTSSEEQRKKTPLTSHGSEKFTFTLDPETKDKLTITIDHITKQRQLYLSTCDPTKLKMLPSKSAFSLVTQVEKHLLRYQIEVDRRKRINPNLSSVEQKKEQLIQQTLKKVCQLKAWERIILPGDSSAQETLRNTLDKLLEDARSENRVISNHFLIGDGKLDATLYDARVLIGKYSFDQTVAITRQDQLDFTRVQSEDSIILNPKLKKLLDQHLKNKTLSAQSICRINEYFSSEKIFPEFNEEALDYLFSFQGGLKDENDQQILSPAERAFLLQSIKTNYNDLLSAHKTPQELPPLAKEYYWKSQDHLINTDKDIEDTLAAIVETYELDKNASVDRINANSGHRIDKLGQYLKKKLIAIRSLMDDYAAPSQSTKDEVKNNIYIPAYHDENNYQDNNSIHHNKPSERDLYTIANLAKDNLTWWERGVIRWKQFVHKLSFTDPKLQKSMYQALTQNNDLILQGHIQDPLIQKKFNECGITLSSEQIQQLNQTLDAILNEFNIPISTIEKYFEVCRKRIEKNTLRPIDKDTQKHLDIDALDHIHDWLFQQINGTLESFISTNNIKLPKDKKIQLTKAESYKVTDTKLYQSAKLLFYFTRNIKNIKSKFSATHSKSKKTIMQLMNEMPTEDAQAISEHQHKPEHFNNPLQVSLEFIKEWNGEFRHHGEKHPLTTTIAMGAAGFGFGALFAPDILKGILIKLHANGLIPAIDLSRNAAVSTFGTENYQQILGGLSNSIAVLSVAEADEFFMKAIDIIGDNPVDIAVFTATMFALIYGVGQADPALKSFLKANLTVPAMIGQIKGTYAHHQMLTEDGNTFVQKIARWAVENFVIFPLEFFYYPLKETFLYPQDNRLWNAAKNAPSVIKAFGFILAILLPGVITLSFAKNTFWQFGHNIFAKKGYDFLPTFTYKKHPDHEWYHLRVLINHSLYTIRNILIAVAYPLVALSKIFAVVLSPFIPALFASEPFKKSLNRLGDKIKQAGGALIDFTARLIQFAVDDIPGYLHIVFLGIRKLIAKTLGTLADPQKSAEALWSFSSRELISYFTDLDLKWRISPNYGWGVFKDPRACLINPITVITENRFTSGTISNALSSFIAFFIVIALNILIVAKDIVRNPVLLLVDFVISPLVRLTLKTIDLLSRVASTVLAGSFIILDIILNLARYTDSTKKQYTIGNFLNKTAEYFIKVTDKIDRLFGNIKRFILAGTNEIKMEVEKNFFTPNPDEAKQKEVIKLLDQKEDPFRFYPSRFYPSQFYDVVLDLKKPVNNTYPQILAILETRVTVPMISNDDKKNDDKDDKTITPQTVTTAISPTLASNNGVTLFNGVSPTPVITSEDVSIYASDSKEDAKSPQIDSK